MVKIRRKEDAMVRKLSRSDRNGELECRRATRTSVHDVPDECLALAFSNLHTQPDRDAASLVCRRWRSLEALSRHSLKVSRLPAIGWSQRLVHTLNAFPNIFHVRMTGNVLTGLPALLRSKHFMHVRTLVVLVAHENPSYDFMACVAEGCPALVSLEVNQCGDVGIEMVLTRCSDMQEMIIHRGGHIIGWGFRPGKRLKTLDIRHGYNMKDALAEGLQGLTSLQTLKLPYMDDADLDISFIGQCCKHIEVLNLFSCNALNNSSIKAIVSGCKNLRVLDARRCINVDLPGWKALACEAINLQVLNVSFLCLNSLCAIQEGCPALCSLTVPHAMPLQRFKQARPGVRVLRFVYTWPDDDDESYMMGIMAL